MRFEDEVKNKLNSIQRRYYITFFSVIVCGLMAHLYQFTNKNFNYDELGQTPAGFGAGIALGRWGLQLVGDVVGRFFRVYSLPMTNGLITLLFVAISACLIVKVFDIKDKVCCFLIGGVIATFPALVGTYFFMFTAPFYGLAFCLSCVSALVIVNNNMSWKLVLGLLCLTFTTGIYQSYCGVTLCILLIDVVIRFYVKSEDWKKILRRGITYCVTFAVAVVIYVVISKLASSISGIPLQDYRGMSDMGSVNIGAMLFAVLKSYKLYFLLMTPKDIYQVNCVRICCLVFIVLNALNLYFFIKRIRIKEEIMDKIGFVISVAFLPISFFFFEILTQGAGGVYAIMTYSMVFVFVVPVVLYEKNNQILVDGNLESIHYESKADLPGRILGGVIFANILIYIWFANGNYQALQYTNMHDLAYFETLATQVKSLEGYSEEMPVAFVGSGFVDSTFTSGSLLGDYFDIGGKLETNVNYFNAPYLWISYLGYAPEIIEFEDSAYLLENEEIKNMPSYPNSGSIKIVDGMVIIRCSD